MSEKKQMAYATNRDGMVEPWDHEAVIAQRDALVAALERARPAVMRFYGSDELARLDAALKSSRGDL